YDKYSPALYGMICRMTNNKHVAEECLTATFLKSWNEIAAFPGLGTSLFIWLLKLARQSALEAIAQEEGKISGTQIYVNGHDRHYSAFELVYFKGLSAMQAAELSGITIIEFRANIRIELQNMKCKKEKA
ncbi:MAG: sigma factor, partial [Ginsengibacter sp.]